MEAEQPIIVAPEIMKTLAAEDIAALERQALTGYRCVTCGEPGELETDPAAVVVLLMEAGPPGAGPVFAHVRLAHKRCSPSRIIRDPGVLAVPAELAMHATAVVLPDGWHRRALLIVEPTAQTVSVSDGGERRDELIAGLLGQGLHLVSSPWERAPEAPGWSVSLPSRTKAIVRDPDGEEIYVGELPQPRPWRKTAARGQIELLVGDIGLPAIGPGDPRAGLRAIEGAAREGHLVGGTVAVHRCHRRSWPGSRSSAR